jgi:uncharacterized protein YqjF (DUF2071 family)
MIIASPHQTAKPLADPLFRCSWERAVFLHYRVAPQFLQPQIPFELDLHDGHAYVSLVAFTLRNMRLNHPHLKFLTQPLHTHAFLNVRTYVRVGALRGIYFLAEWLNNRLATMLGPTLYGLPYRFGKLTYSHKSRHLSGEVLGSIAGGTTMPVRPALRYLGSIPSAATYEPTVPGTLEHFLLERYIAFTKHGPFRRLFRVWHEPWPQTSIDAQIESASLLHTTGRWFSHAQFLSANFSPGVRNVQMGWPQRL